MQLFVLGMHRSGTSSVTRLLNMMGAYFGPEGSSTGASEENPKGFWERRDVREFCDSVLHSAQANWWKVADFRLQDVPEATRTELEARFSDILFKLDAHRPWVVKEPRMCLLFELVRPLLEMPIVIIVHREPVEVALSLKKRNDFPLPVGVSLWERYCHAAISSSVDVPRVQVNYKEVLANPVETVQRLNVEMAELGVRGLRMPSAEEIRAFITPALYRQRAQKSDRPALLNQRQLTLASSLDSGEFPSTRAMGPPSAGGYEILASFEAAVETKERAVELENESSTLRCELRQAEAAGQRLEQELRQAEAAGQRLEQELRQIEVVRDRLADDARGAEIQITSLLEYMQRLEDYFRMLLESRRWRIGSMIGQASDYLRFRSPERTAADAICDLLNDLHRQPDLAPSDDASYGVVQTEQWASQAEADAPHRVESPLTDVVIYTAVSGEYDELKTPVVLPTGWELVCFHDNWDSVSSPWSLRPFDRHHVDATRRARFVKVHPHLYFPDKTWSIWVDANLLINGDLTCLVERVEASGSIGTYLHPHRTDILQEAEEILSRGGLDHPEVVRRQVDYYRENQLGLEAGLFETNVVVRRHMDREVIDLMTAWWREIDNGSKRDQLSLPVVVEQAGIDVIPLAPSGQSVRTSPLFTRFHHGRNRIPA